MNSPTPIDPTGPVEGQVSAAPCSYVCRYLAWCRSNRNRHTNGPHPRRGSTSGDVLPLSRDRLQTLEAVARSSQQPVRQSGVASHGPDKPRAVREVPVLRGDQAGWRVPPPVRVYVLPARSLLELRL